MIKEPKSYAHLRAVSVPFQILVAHGLSPNQWCLLYLMHFNMQHEQLAYLTGEDAPQGWHPDELNDLHDRFYLIHEPQPGNHPKLSPKNFRVSERFTDLLALLKPKVDDGAKMAASASVHKADMQKPVIPGMGLDELEMFDELFAAYPSHITVQNQLVSGRSGNYDDMASTYAAYLTSRKAVSHPVILELVNWAKENSLITMGLAKFIAGREWLGLQELRDAGHGGSYDNQEAI